jgi:hypothetical protein
MTETWTGKATPMLKGNSYASYLKGHVKASESDSE